MKILLMLAGAGLVLELLTHVLSGSRAWRRLLAPAALVANGLATGALLAAYPNGFTVLLSVISLYRLFNMVRVVKERMHERYLRSATRTTTWTLLGMQLAVVAVWWAWHLWSPSAGAAWTLLSVIQLAVAGIFGISVIRTLRKTAWPPEADTHLTDHELPTVTVAIPARNETEDLQDCLQSLIASDYPKLEVIVLDDCSQLKRTPEIIKQFAHDGVRFIQGQEPEATWLSKNQAYDRLAGEASGEFIIFAGVDVRFERRSLRTIMNVMQSRNKQMMCILPRRQPAAYGQLSLVQAMRYWWELVPPRRLFHRPPVISSCWVVSRATLKRTGGFAAVSRSIMPEAHFAKAVLTADGYSFLRSTDTLGISSNKRVADQRETAIRMRYPQLHKRPQQVAALTLWELIILLGPFAMLLVSIWLPINSPALYLAAIAGAILMMTYLVTVLSTRVNSLWFAIIGLPFAVLSDIALLHYSMYKYEFSKVDWKGRNVCIPVMHVVSKLPDLR